MSPLLIGLLANIDTVLSIGSKVVAVASAVSVVIPNTRVTGVLGIARTVLDWTALNVGFAKNRLADANASPMAADNERSKD